MKEKPSKLGNVVFALTHPLLMLQAIDSQIAVKMGIESPPPGNKIEDFYNLSKVEAAKIVQETKKMEQTKIPNMVWSPEDQQRMADGKMPKGHPEHNSI